MKMAVDTKAKDKDDAKKIAVVRIRGVRSVKPGIRKTFELMRLERPNHCVVVSATPQNMGMIQVVKDYVTFGPIKEETLGLLLKKRGGKGRARLRDADAKKGEAARIAKEVFAGAALKSFVDPVFRLHPPKKGMKDIKIPYPIGVIGSRDNMDAFIRRMI